MLDEKYVYKSYIFLGVKPAVTELNKILFRSHSRELQLRQNILANEGEIVLRQKRLFDITDDPNSDSLCSCFKDITIRVIDKSTQVYRSIEKQINVIGKPYYHVFLSDGKTVIDPTMGQYLRKQNINPENYRKQNKHLFVDNVYIGLPEIRDINYF